MPIRVAVPKETLPGENRVALIPEVVRKLAKLDVEVLLESGAGVSSHYPDDEYDAARIVTDTDSLYREADVVLAVQPPSADTLGKLREGSIYIGLLLPFQRLEHIKDLKDRNITSFAMELVPRISRAQSMDVLSSQAAVAGYKAVLLPGVSAPSSKATMYVPPPRNRWNPSAPGLLISMLLPKVRAAMPAN